eukprot:7724565-Pyramimonas_sp.AAC.1
MRHSGPSIDRALQFRPRDEVRKRGALGEPQVDRAAREGSKAEQGLARPPAGQPEAVRGARRAPRGAAAAGRRP